MRSKDSKKPDSTLTPSNYTAASSSHSSIDIATTHEGIAENDRNSRQRGKKRRRIPSTAPLSLSLSDPVSYPPSSDVPVVTALDNVRAFFKFKCPKLTSGGTHTRSTNTRIPLDFDTHLLQDYRLMHVVKLKKIPEDLASVAQAALDDYRRDLPADSDVFPSPDRLAKWFDLYELEKIERESDVERLYRATVAKGCLVVAGTLAYGHESWSAGCLQWTFRAPSKKEGSGAKNKGVADGFLNIFEEKGSSLTPEQQLVFDYFPVLAIWEFKNLNFSILESGISTMEGAVNGFLEGAFPWATCEFGPWQCQAEHPNDVNTWSPMGWDAKNPPCAAYLQARDSPERKILLKERILEANRAKRDAKEAAKKAKKAKHSRMRKNIDDGEGSDTVTEGQAEDTVIVESDEADLEIGSKSILIPQLPRGQTRRPLKQVSRFKKASRDLLQQAWAEAVRHDATFMVINTGNTEIICIRDRLTQTLYISDIIEIHKCENYMKIHTGLMIAAIRDAEDRARLLIQSTPRTWNPMTDNKALDLKHKSIEGAREILLEQARRRPWLKIQPAERLRHFPFTKDLYHRQTKESLTVTSRESSPLPYIMSESQVDSAASRESSLPLSQVSESSSSRIPIWTFMENIILAPRPRHSADHDFEETPPDPGAIFHLNVKYEPFYGTRVCRGTLKIHGTLLPAKFKGAHHPVLVIKSASEARDIELLKYEHDILCKLNETGKIKGIPQVYGLFYNRNELEEGKSFAVLVMEDMGSTLERFLEEVKIREEKRHRRKVKRQKHTRAVVDASSYAISDEQMLGFRELLRRVHEAGYAHGNLSPKSLAFKNQGVDVSIIGYERAMPLPSELAARIEVTSKERGQLDELLGTLVSSHYLSWP
ncbi:hypothetical protein C0995_016306 [Termitomyces sp. Mi166|nr:hypothetical protein C0995_016306 [Termitomyces sp. Mi166\